MPSCFIAQIQRDDRGRYQYSLAELMPTFERHGERLLTASLQPVDIIKG